MGPKMNLTSFSWRISERSQQVWKDNPSLRTPERMEGHRRTEVTKIEALESFFIKGVESLRPSAGFSFAFFIVLAQIARPGEVGEEVGEREFENRWSCHGRGG